MVLAVMVLSVPLCLLVEETAIGQQATPLHLLLSNSLSIKWFQMAVQ